MPNKVSSYPADNQTLNTICLVVGIVLSICLFFILIVDAQQSIFYPLPHDYGEGILAWMTRELYEGRSPYGDITAAPSRYACYGPLPAWIASVFCSLLGDDNMKFIVSGRILNTAYWVITGALLGLLCRPRLAALILAPTIPLVISHSSFMCSFRVDSMLIMLEAAILYVLVRQPTHTLRFSLPTLVSALVLVKPTASLDLIPLGILAFALSKNNWSCYLQRTFKPGLFAVVAAPAVFFFNDIFHGGWMTNNILTVQRISGWAEPYSPDFMTRTFFLTGATWVLVLWALWGPTVPRTAKARLVFTALALGLLLNGSLALKYGAVTNYYFPLLVLMMGAASLWMRTYPQILLFMGILTIAALPLSKHGGPFRQLGPESGRPTEQSQKISALHHSDHIVTEDAFFSVLAGKQPLISDIFQYNLIASQKGISNEKLLQKTKVFWGDFRVRHLLGKDENSAIEFRSPSFVPESLPAPPYLKGLRFRPQDLPPAAAAIIPYSPKHRTPWQSYLKNCVIPSGTLLLVGLFWNSRRSTWADATDETTS